MHVGGDSECWRLREQVGRLEAQVEEEREAHLRSANQLHAEVDHIAQLEGSLQQCKMEMGGHMTRLEEDSTHHTTQIWQMKSQVGMPIFKWILTNLCPCLCLRLPVSVCLSVCCVPMCR